MEKNIILFGAGTLGKLMFYALTSKGKRIKYYCDSSKSLIGKKYMGIDVITPETLGNISSDSTVYICHNYVDSPMEFLNHFVKVDNCIKILEQADFGNSETGMEPEEIERQIDFHKTAWMKQENHELNLKYTDIVITEKCSLKCKDCSNLMQYYHNPVNCDSEVLFKSVDNLMNVIGHLNEFRVIGGEPFMNRRIYEYLDYLKQFNKVDRIVIFTNGTILPDEKKLSVLKDRKIYFEISDYGKLSRKLEKLIEMLNKNKIHYIVNKINGWQDIGDISFKQHSEEILRKMFSNCCVNDVFTLLHGKLYRCPLSANATNLKIIPQFDNEIVDLLDSDIDLIKQKITDLYKNKTYINSCKYCYGRDFSSKEVEPAIQIREPLEAVQCCSV